MKKTGLCVILLIFFSIIYLYAEKAPGFALLNSKNKLVFKSDFQGNIIIAFWASWCQPCKKHIPHLLLLEKKYRVEKNLTLVLISVDDKKNGLPGKKSRAALREIGVTSDFLQDFYHVAYKKYAKSQKLLIVPATFLVDKDNTIVYKKIGVQKNSIKELEEIIHKLKK